MRRSIAGGQVVLDDSTGALQQFVHTSNAQRRYLLEVGQACHTADHAWGCGHFSSDRGSGRWNTPTHTHIDNDTATATYPLLPELELHVERRFGAVLQETYTWANTGSEPITFSALGIQTPFADLYESAELALTSAVNAHVFTGGRYAWVAAQPMDGSEGVLGLTLTAGALHSYSVESRNVTQGSNFRGHLVLNVTQHALAPHAFGGQPQITVEPGSTYRLSWQLGFYPTINELLANYESPAVFEHYWAQVGESISVTTPEAVDSPDATVQIERAGANTTITADMPGSYTVNIGTSMRTEVLFHPPVGEVIRARARYMLSHQRARERAGALAHAFVPVDTRTGITILTNGWHDWGDGSERIAMPLLLQRAVTAGVLVADEDVEGALAGWTQYARAYLLDESFAPRRCANEWDSEIRLYDMPWLALFFLERYRGTGDDQALRDALAILDRGAELGLGRYLAIGYSEASVKVASECERAGRPEAAARLRQRVVESARFFLDLGEHLPEHEVSYEQSMVAPLLDLLIHAWELTGDQTFHDAVAARLPWLLAFGGPQPHARLHHVPIRHWDGYWFGANRLWGDVFAHHWAALTAQVIYRLPADLATPELRCRADGILRATLANVRADGSATCAFVFPASIDGQPAHRADPVANDQDWPLAIWLELAEFRGASLE